MGRCSPSVEKLFIARNQVMKYQAFVTLLEKTQIKVVQECKNWIPFHRLDALICLRRRINALSPDLKIKYPFSIRMFERSLDRAQVYIDFLSMYKSNWTRIRFHFPILWGLVMDGEDNDFFKTVNEQRGFYSEIEGVYSSYKWSDECLNNSPSTPVIGSRSYFA